MDSLKPPEPLNLSTGNISENWRRFKQRWELFRKASGAGGKTDEVQCAIFLHIIGDEAIEVYNTMGLSDGDRENLQAIVDGFERHCNPQKNVSYERFKFGIRKQQEGETIDQYVTELKSLATNCEYGDLKDSLIRDRILLGIRDDSQRSRLFRERDLTLLKTVELCRAHEMSQTQLRSLTNRASACHISEIRDDRRDGGGGTGGSKLSNYKRNKTAPERKFHNKHTQQKNGSNCKYCGYDQHARSSCPARDKSCNGCGKSGHFVSRCLQKRVQEVTVDDVRHRDPEKYFLGEVKVGESHKPWRTVLEINRTDVDFKIDCGADVTVISDKSYKKLYDKPKLKSTSVVLDSPGGKLNCLGQFVARCLRKQKVYFVRVFVVQGMCDNLLSRSAAVNMNLIARLDAVSSSDESDEAFGELGLLKGKQVKIELRDNAVPYCAYTARRIPLPQVKKVEEELKRMERLNVITKVTEPSDWCSNIVVVPKGNEKVRICVDLKPLNKAVKRELYTLPTVDDILHKLAGANIFSKLDASSGYWQLALDKESSKLTTFITPFGRYRFLRLPFGICSASEIFQREMSDLLCDLPGVAVFQDDVIVFGSDMVEHDKNLENVMRKIRESDLKLNKDKCYFRRESIEFLGHLVSKEGISSHPDKIKAITELKEPTNVKELRQVMGMINYLSRHVPYMSQIATPMNDLLRKDVAWAWLQPQQLAFEKLKKLISEAPVLAFYDIGKPTIVSADASQYGLGAVLFQEHSDGFRPVAFSSRRLSAAEEKYAQIEKECLASTWACEKFNKYVCGLESFRLLTDHKPLVPLINNRSINETPIRCQRLLLRLMRYNAIAEYVPGKNLVVSDLLSRSPLTLSETPDTEPEVIAYVQEIGANLSIRDPFLREIKLETDRDDALQKAILHTLAGWPRYLQGVDDTVRDLYSVRSELSVVDGLLVRGTRIVIPNAMRQTILEKIHDGHQGLSKCRDRAKQTVWWPGLNENLERVIRNCNFCQVKRSAQRHETLKSTPLPDRPWQKIAADLCDFKGSSYLVVVDYYSRYIEIAHLPQTKSYSVIGKLKNMISRWGIPETLVSDNGPQFSSYEFKKFTSQYKIDHVTSSPHFHQSNGEAERAVRTAKDILRQNDVFLALLSYRDAPISATGYSPNELMLSRPVRTTVPVLSQSLEPKWPDKSEVSQNDRKSKSDQTFYFNRRPGARDLSPLNPGDTVRMKLDTDKQWSQTGIVAQDTENPRSYIVRGESGGLLRRNRKHLLHVPRDSCEQNLGINSHICSPEFIPYSENAQINHDTEQAQEPVFNPNTQIEVNDNKTSSFGRVIRPVKRLDL